MARPILIYKNPNELKYYSFMISLNECTGSCKVLSPKICVGKETKYINVKVFNTVTNKDEAKVMIEHISCNCKCKFNSTKCNSKQKWNHKTCQCECEDYHKCGKDYTWNPSTWICGSSKYLKSVPDTSGNKCDESVVIMNNLSTKRDITRKKTNTIIKNVTNTASLIAIVKKIK